MIYLTSVNDNSKIRQNEIEELIHKTALGDSEAFAALYEKTRSSVYGFALSVLKNAHDAQDVLQSCYVSIYTAAVDYRAQGKPLAWILTIAKNLCYARLREYGRAEAAPEDIEDSLALSHELTSDDRLLAQYCLSMLGEAERQILVLHAIAGFKHREIAELLEIPLPTVLSRYNRAIKKIKKHFEGGDRDDR